MSDVGVGQRAGGSEFTASMRFGTAGSADLGCSSEHLTLSWRLSGAGPQRPQQVCLGCAAPNTTPKWCEARAFDKNAALAVAALPLRGKNDWLSVCIMDCGEIIHCRAVHAAGCCDAASQLGVSRQ